MFDMLWCLLPGEARTPFDVDVRLPSRGRGERSTRRPGVERSSPAQCPAAPSLQRCCPPVGAASVPSSGGGRGSVGERLRRRSRSYQCSVPAPRRCAHAIQRRGAASGGGWEGSARWRSARPLVHSTVSDGAQPSGAALVPGAGSGGTQPSVRLLSRRRASDETTPRTAL